MAAVTLGDLMNPLTKIEEYTKQTSDKLSKIEVALGKLKPGGGGKGGDKGANKEAAETLSLIGAGAKSMAMGLVAFAVVPKNVGKKFIKFVKGILDVLDLYGTEDAKRGAETLKILGESMMSFAKNLAFATLLLIPSLLLSPITILTIGLFAGVFFLLGKFDKQIDKGATVLAAMGVGLILFGIGLALFTLSAFLILMKPSVLFIMVASIILIGGAIALLGLVWSHVAKGALVLTLMGISLMLFGVGLGIFALATAFISLEQLGIMVGVIIGIGIALALIGLLALPIILGAAALMVVGVALILFGVGVGLFRLATWGMETEDIINMSKTILMIGLAIAPLGLLFVPIALGAAAMIIAGVALILLGIGLMLFAGGYYFAADLFLPSFVNPKITEFEAVLDSIASGFTVNPLTAIGMALGVPLFLLGGVALILLGIGLMAFTGGYALSNSVGLWDKSKTKPKIMQFEAVMDSIASGLAVGPFTAIGMLLGAPAFIAGGGALIILSAGLALFTLAYNIGNDALLWKADDDGVMQFEKVMDSIAAGLTLGPAQIVGMYLGAPALIMGGIALAAIAPGIKEFGTLWADTGVKELFEDKPLFVIKTWGGFGDDRIGSNLEWMLRGVAASFNLPVLAIAGMWASAPALIMAGKALQEIAEGISGFQKIVGGIGLEMVTGNITSVITTVSSAFGAIGAGSKGGLLDKLGSIFDVKNPIPGTEQYSAEDVATGIESVAGMGNILVNVAKGVAAFATMKYTDSNGNIVLLDKTAQADAIVNIESVISTVGKAFGKIGKEFGGTAETFWGVEIQAAGDLAKGIKSTAGMGEILVNVAAGVVAFANMKFTNAEGEEISIPTADLEPKGRVMVNIKKVLNAVSDVFGSIGAKSKPDSFLGISVGGTDKYDAEDVRKGIDAVMGVGNILSGVADAVNAFAEHGDKVDVEKIKTFIKGIIDVVGEFGAEEKIIAAKRGTQILKGVFEALAKSADAEDPLEKIATSMGVLKDNINEMDLIKLTKLKSLMYNVNKLQETDSAAQLEAVAVSVSELVTALTPKEEAAAPTEGAGAAAAPTTDAAAPESTDAAILKELKGLRSAVSGLQGVMASLPDDISQIKLKVNVP